MTSPTPVFGHSHDLYKTGDTDAPAVVLDTNGDVTLGLCRRCGKGETELAQPCVRITTAAPPAPLTQRFQFKRGALELSVSVSSGQVLAYLHQPRKAGGPMLAYAACAPVNVRVEMGASKGELPCLWLAGAAFDLRPAEVPRLQKALESLTTKPAAAAAH